MNWRNSKKELPEDFTYNESYGIVWLPLDEMIYPDEN